MSILNLIKLHLCQQMLTLVNLNNWYPYSQCMQQYSPIHVSGTYISWVHRLTCNYIWSFSAILQVQLEVSILEARVYCPMYTIPSRLGSIRHQLQSSTGTVEKLAYCGSLQQQMLVAKCAPEHKRFLLQPSMQICDIVVYLNFHLRFHHTK